MESYLQETLTRGQGGYGQRPETSYGGGPGGWDRPTTAYGSRNPNEFEGVPRIEDIDSYIELLYEELEKKIQSTAKILYLAKDASNLEPLISHQLLLTTIARTLQEELKKSTDLVLNIMYTFYIFSMFSQFHQFIMQHKIGDTTFKIIDFEIKRHEVRVKGYQEKKQSGTLTEEELEKEQKKLKAMIKKQDRLLIVSLKLLLNLAEDVAVEQKMKKRNIVQYLSVMLDRRNGRLLTLTVYFLKKLSIFEENKGDMAQERVVEKLCRFIPCNDDALMSVTLRLLLNLSFDSGMREEMVRQGLIQKLVEVLKKPNYRQIILRLLYHLSMDDRAKSMFTYTDAVPLVLQLILHFPETLLGRELAALAVNVCHNARNAEQMMERDGLGLLMNRVFRSRDPLLMKIIRTISQHDGPGKVQFMEYLPDLVRLAVTCEDPDLLVEVLGTLGNLPVEQSPRFPQLLEQFKILEFLSRNMVPGATEDDVILECIIFLGAFAGDADCAQQIARTKLLVQLYELIAAKQEDDEMVLQLCFTLSRLMLFEDIRLYLINQTQIVQYLVSFMQDRNETIRAVADGMTDMIMESDEQWAKRIRQKKFQMWNQEWLEVIEQDSAAEMEHGYAPGSPGSEGDGDPYDMHDGYR
eukprot:tig00000198_g16069.t1